MSVVATEIIGEVIDPFTGILGTAEELAKVAGYQVLREAVELRIQDTNGDRGLSDHWLPTDGQLQTMRESIGPILPYLSARKRLISLADNPKFKQ